MVNKHSTVVSGKQAHYYSFPCMYMDSYHSIHGFTKLPITLIGYLLPLHDKRLPLTMHLSLCSMGVSLYVTGPAKIDHVSAKKSPIFSVFAV